MQEEASAASASADRFESFGAWLQQKGDKPYTVQSRVDNVQRADRFILEQWGVSLNETTPEQLERYLAPYEERPNTRNRYLYDLRSYFTWARGVGLCSEDPTETIHGHFTGERGSGPTEIESTATIRVLRPDEPYAGGFSRPAGHGAVLVGDFQAIAAWMRWMEAQGVAETTVRLYAYGLFRLFAGQVRGSLAETTEEHITAFLASVGNRASAKVHYFRGIRSFFRYAAARGIVAFDPSAGLRARKPWRSPPVALTEEELTRYLIAAAWRHPRRAWTLMLCFGAGLRRSEAATIRPEDVQGGVVHVRHAKYGKQRRVELGPLARVALEELRPWYDGTVLGVKSQAVTEWAHQAAVDSDLLPKVHGRVAHILRSSFATYLLRHGTPVEVVKELLGHESIATTSLYLAVEPEERRAAVELI